MARAGRLCQAGRHQGEVMREEVSHQEVLMGQGHHGSLRRWFEVPVGSGDRLLRLAEVPDVRVREARRRALLWLTHVRQLQVCATCRDIHVAAERCLRCGAF